jgi:hypothetical protein
MYIFIGIGEERKALDGAKIAAVPELNSTHAAAP